jgi:cellulose synthase/poly-beta-1,6-N-acetylglucosamine synthase-like glycosyltransferase
VVLTELPEKEASRAFTMFSYAFSLLFSILIVIATLLVAYSGLVFIAGFSFKGRQRKSGGLPFISILLAAKNEGNYIGNILSELIDQDYPAPKYEVVVSEDGSTDATRQIAEEWAKRYPDRIKLVLSAKSIGKPAALNRALTVASGEIIGQIDADSSVEKNLLRSVACVFEPDVYAIQGESSVRNKNQSLIAKLTSYEHDVWNRFSLKGRARLNLFVPCTGNLSFVRRDVLTATGGWDRNALAEDVELSLQAWLKGYKFEYHPEIKCKEMTVSRLASFYRQRLRWYGGYFQSLFRHGNLLRKFSAQAIDGELMLMGPMSGVLGVLILSLGAVAVLAGINTIQIISLTPYTIAAYTVFSLVSTFAAVKFEGEKHSWKLMPAIYVYWFLGSLVSSVAFLKILFRRKIAWTRTEK